MASYDFIWQCVKSQVQYFANQAQRRFHRPARTARSHPWPKPGVACKPVTIVLDNGPIHSSKATRAALVERKHWLTPEWMAKYVPELNDIERDWKTLKAHRLAHKTFRNRDELEIAIDADIEAINSTRKSHPLANQRISA